MRRIKNCARKLLEVHSALENSLRNCHCQSFEPHACRATCAVSEGFSKVQGYLARGSHREIAFGEGSIAHAQRHAPQMRVMLRTGLKLRARF